MKDNRCQRAYLYDANGNVTQVVNLAADPNNPAGALIAKYEYDPYGNNLLDPNDPNESGTFAHANPFRFSTKYFDAETGLSYFGGRYYHASLGRWLNRDPIGELGGANLYAYAGNDPVDRIDPLGHAACVRGWHGCPGGDRDDSDGGGRCPKKGQPDTQPTTKPTEEPVPCEEQYGRDLKQAWSNYDRCVSQGQRTCKELTCKACTGTLYEFECSEKCRLRATQNCDESRKWAERWAAEDCGECGGRCPPVPPPPPPPPPIELPSCAQQARQRPAPPPDSTPDPNEPPQERRWRRWRERRNAPVCASAWDGALSLDLTLQPRY